VQQPPRAGRAGSHRGPPRPAAAAGPPCRQPPRAVPAAAAGRPCRQTAAGRASSRRGPMCSGQTTGRSCSRRMQRSPPGTGSPSASQPCQSKDMGPEGLGVGGWVGGGVRGITRSLLLVPPENLSPHAHAGCRARVGTSALRQRCAPCGARRDARCARCERCWRCARSGVRHHCACSCRAVHRAATNILSFE
jgi:hypothetical protein